MVVKRTICTFLALAAVWHAPAQAADARQYKLEAAFLYNFFNYITWPGYAAPDQLKEATICVTAGDPVKEYLGYVQKKMASQRTLTIRTWQPGEPIDNCHLLFVRNGHAPQGAQTLTVAENSNFLNKGGMVALAQQQGRIALRINNSLLGNHGFQVSSRLLSLAQEVK